MLDLCMCLHHLPSYSTTVTFLTSNNVTCNARFHQAKKYFEKIKLNQPPSTRNIYSPCIKLQNNHHHREELQTYLGTWRKNSCTTPTPSLCSTPWKKGTKNDLLIPIEDAKMSTNQRTRSNLIKLKYKINQNSTNHCSAHHQSGLYHNPIFVLWVDLKHGTDFISCIWQFTVVEERIAVPDWVSQSITKIQRSAESNW
jgi:hypothetical protein